MPSTSWWWAKSAQFLVFERVLCWFQLLLYSLAPEVLLAQSEPIVESLDAVGGEVGAEGGGVGGDGQPVVGRGGAEGVGGLQPRVQEVETVEGVVVAVLDRLGSLGLSSADHLGNNIFRNHN